MKKIFFSILTIFILSGCGIKVINEQQIPSIVDGVLDNVDQMEVVRRNNILTYYDYYLPSSMAEEELDSDSVVLKYENSRIIMNLNINNIINEKYYADKVLIDEGFFLDEYKIYERSGNYDHKGTTKMYNYRLYKYGNLIALHLQTSDMNYYGQVTFSDIRELTRLLMIMAKNTEIRSNEIIKNYSNFDVIDYKRKQIDLFDSSMPTSGELSNLLIDGAKIGDGQIVTDGKIDTTKTNNGAPIE